MFSLLIFDYFFDFECYWPLIMSMKKEVIHLLFNFGHNLASWHYSATGCQDDSAWPHVAWMTLLGHILPVWRCSATCCQDDTAQLHVARMTQLGHMLPRWHCSATCCQDNSAECSLTMDMKFCHRHHIFLISQPPATIFKHLHTFNAKNIPSQRSSKNNIERFLGIKILRVLLYSYKKKNPNCGRTA